MEGLHCVHNALRGVTLPVDVVRREVNCVNNKRRSARKQRRWLRSAAWTALRARGEETPSEPKSSGNEEEDDDEDEVEGEVSPSSHSSPPEDLPSLGDLFNQQAEISVGAHQMKHPRIDTEALSDPPP
jgi:hypothetical protein